jgi:nucleolar protein 58
VICAASKIPAFCVLIRTALEQTAALVEGKVTPRLTGLLDSIKDERKASLAVADPKLGMTMSFASIAIV